MIVTELTGKRVALVGLGAENGMLAVYLSQRGMRFSVCDVRADRRSSLSSLPWVSSVDDWNLGEGYLENLERYEVLFRTPGISPLQPQLASAAADGVLISSQMELFFNSCPAPILGVTGTKGKGTTVSAVVEMLAEGPYRQVWLGGNIGTPPIQFVDDVAADDIVVLELSSFQLHELKHSPHIAVILNLFDDHLDYHADRAEYSEAKRTIGAFQSSDDYLVLNEDADDVTALGCSAASRRVGFSITREVATGCYASEEALWLRHGGEERRRVRPLADIPLRGDHNLANIAAAAAAAAAAGASIESISRGIDRLRPLPHRLELVADVAGVRYFNDSLATVPEAALASVRSFREPVHLLAGGSAKGADFAALAMGICDATVVTVALVGEEAERISAALTETGFRGDAAIFESFDEAFRTLSGRARLGDVVLLAPACASFGMFDGYAERGRRFAELVAERCRLLG